MILEYGLGAKYQFSLPRLYEKIRKGTGFLGWMATISVFLILVYYCVVMAWVTQYLWVGNLQEWASSLDNSKAYFFETILGISEGPFKGLGSVQWTILLGLVAIWGIDLPDRQEGSKTHWKSGNVHGTFTVTAFNYFDYSGSNSEWGCQWLKSLPNP